MRKLYLFITFLMIFITLQAQNISVLPGDFYRDSKDLTARTQVVKNENNKNCALLKIITTEKGFTFEPDALGICKEVEYKTSEIWVWLAPGSRRITIKHPQLGQLRDYEYPEAIEASTVYVMKLTTAKISTVVENVNTSNYLALRINPAEASVKIDGKMVPVSAGQYQTRLPVGSHTYEASCDMYHTAKGKFNIVPDSTTYLTLELKPNYGFLKVESNPESGALVYVNSKQVGTTPYESDKMNIGKYTVQVVKDMYNESSKEVWIKEGETTTAVITMLPDFAEPAFTCSDADAEIWINDEYKGKGSWKGRLTAGPYIVEVRKKSCRSVTQQFEFKNGDKQNIDLSAPEPIYGKLDVTTVPFGAEIRLDGNKLGMTPRQLDKVQIGEYILELKKEGYSSITKRVKIEENKTLEVNDTLKVYTPQKTVAITERKTEYQNKKRSTKPVKTPNKTKATVRNKMDFFFTLNAAYAVNPQWSFGVTLGAMNQWGWYVDVMTNCNFEGITSTMQEGIVYEISGKSSTSRHSVMIGGIYRPCYLISIHLGAGVGYRARNYYAKEVSDSFNYETLADHFKDENGKMLSDPDTRLLGFNGEAKLVLHIKSVLVSAGVATVNFKYMEFKFGVGICLEGMKK